MNEYLLDRHTDAMNRFIKLCLLVYILHVSRHLINGAVRNNPSQRNQQRSSSSFNTATLIRQPSKCNYNGVNIKSGDYYRLPDNVEPKKYRLRMRIDNRAGKLFGHSMIGLFIHNNTNVIEFNSVNLNIHAVSFKTRTVTGKFEFSS